MLCQTNPYGYEHHAHPARAIHQPDHNQHQGEYHTKHHGHNDDNCNPKQFTICRSCRVKYPANTTHIHSHNMK